MSQQPLDWDVFKVQMKRLSANLGRQIKMDTLDLIYAELSWIPTEAWESIISSAIDQWDSWPRNFPKAIKGLWFKWQGGHGAAIEYQDCIYCYETGVLDFEYSDGANGTVLCGHCDNFHRHMGEKLNFLFEKEGRKELRRWLRLTIQEISARGWRWDEPPRACSAEEAFAAIDDMHDALDKKAEATRVEKYKQARFDVGRPTREQSLTRDDEREIWGE